MFISSFLVPFVALGACVLAVPAVSDTPHDPSAAYDLTRSGAGGYPIEPPNLLTHLDTRGTPKHSRDLAASGPPPQSDSPPRFDGTCMYDERHEVIAALAVSRAYLTAAIEYLESRNDKALYKRWFGAYDRRRAGIVLHTLTWIRNEVIVVTPFSCACTLQNRPSWYDGNNPSTMYLCTPFWRAERRGSWPSKALILVRSAMYLYAPVLDNFTVEACERMARTAPENAIEHSPNYLEFIRTVSRIPRGIGSPFSV